MLDVSRLAAGIRIDMRYAGSENFVGRPIDGYAAPRCLLKVEAAAALARVQRELGAEQSRDLPDNLELHRAVIDYLRLFHGARHAERIAHLRAERLKAMQLAQQKADPGAATDKDLVALGEKIYRGGIQDRNIASCAGCHSPNGAGIPAQYPRLSGQHAQYIVTQLNHFRDGTRDNNQQMTDVAAKLNDKEIKALGEYIAGLK